MEKKNDQTGQGSAGSAHKPKREARTTMAVLSLADRRVPALALARAWSLALLAQPDLVGTYPAWTLDFLTCHVTFQVVSFFLTILAVPPARCQFITVCRANCPPNAESCRISGPHLGKPTSQKKKKWKNAPRLVR